ncbi:hypothetical protein FACS1894196_1410 [Clostridia bacterium]|nr:hypothetical protein FACS1894196_1410 [Clostridia bacterium]
MSARDIKISGRLVNVPTSSIPCCNPAHMAAKGVIPSALWARAAFPGASALIKSPARRQTVIIHIVSFIAFVFVHMATMHREMASKTVTSAVA